MNRTIHKEKIKVIVNGEPLSGILFTSYSGYLFLRKVNQWVEVEGEE